MRTASSGGASKTEWRHELANVCSEARCDMLAAVCVPSQLALPDPITWATAACATCVKSVSVSPRRICGAISKQEERRCASALAAMASEVRHVARPVRWLTERGRGAAVLRLGTDGMLVPPCPRAILAAPRG